MKTMLPKDPVILYSYINTMLRDKYSSLAELCGAEGIDQEEISRLLQSAGFAYDEEINQFR